MLKKAIITGLLIIISLGISLGFYQWNEFHKLKQIAQKRHDKYKALQILTQALPKLKKRWMYGDQEGYYENKSFKCPREIEYNPNVDSGYLKCNPNYLQCFFSGKAGVINPVFTIYIKRIPYKVRANPIFDPIHFFSKEKRFYKIITKSNTEGASVPKYGVLINLSVDEFPDYSINIILEDSCHDSYLPQDIYAYGLYPIDQPEKDWIWDNKNRHIYIDEHLVTFRDIIEWKSFDKNFPKKIKIPDNSQEWPFPATGLKLLEMKQYCAFKGKQLLQAHYFDAATFLKINQNDEKVLQIESINNSEEWNNEEEFLSQTNLNKDSQEEDSEYFNELITKDSISVKRSIYPWTKRSYDFIQDYIKERTYAPHTQLYEKECKLVFSKECIDLFPFKTFTDHSSSWTGISDVMGGYLEAVNNPLYPNQNLKASSFYFEISSHWHQLGLRAEWDGRGFLPKNFNWSNNLYLEIKEQDQAFIESPEHSRDPYKVGFRCMKYEGGY